MDHKSCLQWQGWKMSQTTAPIFLEIIQIRREKRLNISIRLEFPPFRSEEWSIAVKYGALNHSTCSHIVVQYLSCHFLSLIQYVCLNQLTLKLTDVFIHKYYENHWFHHILTFRCISTICSHLFRRSQKVANCFRPCTVGSICVFSRCCWDWQCICILSAYFI